MPGVRVGRDVAIVSGVRISRDVVILPGVRVNRDVAIVPRVRVSRDVVIMPAVRVSRDVVIVSGVRVSRVKVKGKVFSRVPQRRIESGQLSTTCSNATEVSKWATPICSRPQPGTDNGVRDYRSN